MGDDYTNRQILLANRSVTRDDVVEAIRMSMKSNGYMEDYTDAANRRIAIGPQGKWLSVYDSAGSGEDWDEPAFVRLSEDLSRLAPLVETRMDDSASVQFQLYFSGALVAQHRSDPDRASGAVLWPEAPPGDNADLWAVVFQDPALAQRLRTAWSAENPDEILSNIADVLDWHPLYCTSGYTIDYDGVPVYFREYFADDGVDVSGFTEMHFRRKR